MICWPPAPEAVEKALAAAIESVGLKCVHFPLSPLEPLAQARLFLRRTSRPVRPSDFAVATSTIGLGAEAADDVLQPQMPHAELLALAETPRLKYLQGNPRRIIAAAQGLGPLERPASRRAESADSSRPIRFLSIPGTLTNPLGGLPSPPISGSSGTNNHVQTNVDTCPNQTSHSAEDLTSSMDGHNSQTPSVAGDADLPVRRVQLLRPDGRSKQEWLPREMKIREVLLEYTPKSLAGVAEIMVLGCRARPDAVLSDFPDDPSLGFLVLELRKRVEEDDEW